MINNSQVAARFLCAVGLAGMVASCAVIAREGPQDLQISAVKTVDLKSELQIEWMSAEPRPSRELSRLDFTTKVDLLKLAKSHEYNLFFDVSTCGKPSQPRFDGTYGGIYWQSSEIAPYAKPASDYVAAAESGGELTYHVFFKMPTSTTAGPLCFTLHGGNMGGGTFVSNEARLPSR
ncbi:MAG TPA: hypothetical protein VGV14_12940 [Rhodanobacter sp.]|nr:hypothetical protein [Rhodanobacter sp.]